MLVSFYFSLCRPWCQDVINLYVDFHWIYLRMIMWCCTLLFYIILVMISFQISYASRTIREWATIGERGRGLKLGNGGKRWPCWAFLCYLMRATYQSCYSNYLHFTFYPHLGRNGVEVEWWWEERPASSILMLPNAGNISIMLL